MTVTGETRVNPEETEDHLRTPEHGAEGRSFFECGERSSRFYNVSHTTRTIISFRGFNP